jgi:triacylglycerol lipase
MPPAAPSRLNPPYPYKRYPYFQGFDSHPFVPALADFHVANAWWLAEMCMLAYGDEQLCTQAFERSGATQKGWRFELIKRGPAGALFAWNRDTGILAFRGTRVDQPNHFIRDAMADADTLPSPDGAGGKIHPGFAERVDILWCDLEKRLAGAGYQGKAAKPLWLTGHSMGGAMALLAGERMIRDIGLSVRGLYTYGCPKTGDAEFKRRFEAERRGAPVYRVVNAADLVSHLPPLQEYVHVGELLWIDAEGHLHPRAEDTVLDASRPELLINRFRKHASWILPGLFRGLIDHMPINYGTRLFNLL